MGGRLRLVACILRVGEVRMVSEDKNAFLMFHTHEDFFDVLDGEQTKSLMKAIFNYEKRGIEPDLDPITNVAFIAIRQDLDYNKKKWEETRQARSKAGKASAEARKKKAEDKQIEQNEHVLNLLNKAQQDEQASTNPTVYGSESVSVSVSVSDKEKENVQPSRKKEAESLFEDIWKQYPMKSGKAKVSLTQKKRLLNIGKEEMERALERYLEHVEVRRNGGFGDLKYQNGGTFFNSGYVDYLDANFDASMLKMERVPENRARAKPLRNRHVGPEGFRDFSHLEE